MKHLSKIIIAVLFVATVILFIRVQKACKMIKELKQETTISTIDSSKTLARDSILNNNLKLAYIDVARITAEYGYYKEIETKLKAKQQRAESELTRKSEAFKKKYENYMRKAQLGAFLSKESQQAQEQELQQENQNLQILQQQLSTQLQSELQQLDAQATDTIMHHLSLFNKKAQYNLILNSATLLDKGSAKDITDSILNILNQEYKKQKNAKK